MDEKWTIEIGDLPRNQLTKGMCVFSSGDLQVASSRGWTKGYMGVLTGNKHSKIEASNSLPRGMNALICLKTYCFQIKI